MCSGALPRENIGRGVEETVLPRTVLPYNFTTDMFTMNKDTSACLFDKEALSVLSLLKLGESLKFLYL